MKHRNLFFQIIMVALLSLSIPAGHSAAQGNRHSKPAHPQRQTQQRPPQHKPGPQVRPGMGMQASALVVSGDIEVVITPNVREVEVHGDSRYRDAVRIDHNRGALVIRGVSSKSKRLRVHVPASRWGRIELSGGARLRWSGYMDAGRCEIDCRGRSEVRGSITARELTLNVSTRSRADLQGRVETLNVTASGKSQAGCFGLYAGTVRCRASGSSHVDVHSDDAVYADAESGATVHYAGRPGSVRKNELSGGRVKRK